jgi:hypothetical protein
MMHLPAQSTGAYVLLKIFAIDDTAQEQPTGLKYSCLQTLDAAI